MNHWPFIIAAYVITVGGLFGLTFASLAAMRRAEAAADAIRKKS